MFFLIKRLLKGIFSWCLNVKFSLFGKSLKIGSRVKLFGSKLNGFNFINDDCRFLNSTLGQYSYISPQSIVINTHVGKYCSIGPGAKIGLGVHPLDGISTSPYIYNKELFKKSRKSDFKPVTIGHDCWIGANVCILGGIKVGNGVVIGAGAVVTKDIPDFAIVVGVPARVIKYRFNKDQIDKLLQSPWWEKSHNFIISNRKIFNNVELYLKGMKE